MATPPEKNIGATIRTGQEIRPKYQLSAEKHSHKAGTKCRGKSTLYLA